MIWRLETNFSELLLSLQRVSSTLRVGVRFNGSYLIRAIDAYPSTEIWTISTNGESSNMLTFRLLYPYGHDISVRGLLCIIHW